MAIHSVPFRSSSNISQITWDDETLDLVIYFAKGGVYQYPQVPEQDVQGFHDAPSATKYMNTYIEPLYTGFRIG